MKSSVKRAADTLLLLFPPENKNAGGQSVAGSPHTASHTKYGNGATTRASALRVSSAASRLFRAPPPGYPVFRMAHVNQIVRMVLGFVRQAVGKTSAESWDFGKNRMERMWGQSVPPTLENGGGKRYNDCAVRLMVVVCGRLGCHIQAVRDAGTLPGRLPLFLFSYSYYKLSRAGMQVLFQKDFRRPRTRAGGSPGLLRPAAEPAAGVPRSFAASPA